MTLATRTRLTRRALLLLALPALALAQPRPTDEPPAGPPVYRLELIVFEYPEGRSDARPASDSLDFSRLPDPRLMAAARRAVNEHLAALRRALPMLPDPIDGERRAWLENEDERIEPAPDPYLASVPLSAPMRDALERLDASPEHLPVATLAWVQPAERRRRTPMLRVHDDQVVARIEPPAPPAGFFFPDPEIIERALPDAGNVFTATGSSAPVREIPGLPRPPPVQPVYRIDGGARLYRGQFFRLHLDLVLQQPAEPARLPGAPARPADDAVWTLHRLNQTRAIRPGRFEYFDSSRFGVLARLTRFERRLPAPPPEPVSAPDSSAEEPASGPETGSGLPRTPEDAGDAGTSDAAILFRPDSNRNATNAIVHD